MGAQKPGFLPNLGAVTGLFVKKPGFEESEYLSPVR